MAGSAALEGTVAARAAPVVGGTARIARNSPAPRPSNRLLSGRAPPGAALGRESGRAERPPAGPAVWSSAVLAPGSPDSRRRRIRPVLRAGVQAEARRTEGSSRAVALQPARNPLGLNSPTARRMSGRYSRPGIPPIPAASGKAADLPVSGRDSQARSTAPVGARRVDAATRWRTACPPAARRARGAQN